MNPDTMTDVDLVHAVVGGPRERAYRLVERGLRCLAQPASLAERAPACAHKLACAVELGRRAVAAAARQAPVTLPDADAVKRWATARLATLDHEELWLLALDGRHGLRGERMIASGGIHGLHVQARDVLRAALAEAASAFVLVHNHPSGDPTPSEEDMAFTRVVADAAHVVGTPMLDHVIVARDRAASTLALGLLPPPRRVT